MQLRIVIVISALIAAVAGYDNITLGDLDPDVAIQLLSLLAETGLTATGHCDEPQESDMQLVLLTRSNPNNSEPLNLTSPNEIDSSKKVILLIHGWVANRLAFIPATTDAYLQQYDANVIVVDWGKLANILYETSVCYMPKLAEVIANFLVLLEQNFNIPVETVHIVGHSLGAQMGGFIGKNIIAKTGKQIGRITALDPAGPSYQDVSETERLVQSDASFVDVIHTNAAVLGYFGNCGHADFHVNCGTVQPGCPLIDFSLPLEALAGVPVSELACDHVRSILYMIESISHPNNFPSTRCSFCPQICIPRGKTDIVMGEACQDSAAGGYVLTTYMDSPYGRGSPRNII